MSRKRKPVVDGRHVRSFNHYLVIFMIIILLFTAGNLNYLIGVKTWVPLIQGITAVADEIQDDLLQVSKISNNIRRDLRKISLYADTVLLQLVPHQRKAFLNYFDWVYRFPLSTICSGKSKETSGNHRYTIALLNDFFDNFLATTVKIVLIQ